MNIVAILNPNAGGGRTAETWAKVRAHLPGDVEAVETKAPGHGIALARDAIKAGARTIIAVGGDGTINEVVNGFFENEEPISGGATLGIIPNGTGSDFTRILNLPINEKLAADLILSSERRMADLMKVRYTAADGTGRVRYAINVTSFGMGGVVAAKLNRSSKPLGGMIAFLAAMLETAAQFPGNSVTLQLDNLKTIEAKITNVVVGNGQYHGGGMWVCPGAIIDDGLLDVTVIRQLTLFELVKNIPTLYTGGIYSHPKVRSYRAKHVKADSPEPVLIEIDGEALGRLPLEISVMPQAIRVLMP